MIISWNKGYVKLLNDNSFYSLLRNVVFQQNGPKADALHALKISGPLLEPWISYLHYSLCNGRIL